MSFPRYFHSIHPVCFDFSSSWCPFAKYVTLLHGCSFNSSLRNLFIASFHPWFSSPCMIPISFAWSRVELLAGLISASAVGFSGPPLVWARCVEALGSLSAVDYCQPGELVATSVSKSLESALFPKEISWPATPIIVKIRLDMNVASLVAAEEMLVYILRKPSQQVEPC